MDTNPDRIHILHLGHHPWNENEMSKERNVHGTKRPRNESRPMRIGNEKSINLTELKWL